MANSWRHYSLILRSRGLEFFPHCLCLLYLQDFCPNLPIAGRIVLHFLRLSADNALECPDSHLAKLRRFV